MFIKNIFEKFDPFDGRVKGPFRVEFHNIASRARRILKERERDEIKKGLATISQIYLDTRKLLENEFSSGEIDFSVTDAFVLKLAYGNIRLADYGDFKDPRWADYFAILTLALTGSANYPEDVFPPSLDIPGFDNNDKSAYPFMKVAELAIDATEAVTLAEIFLHLEGTNDEALRRVAADAVSQFQRRAALGKHEPKNRVLQSYIRYAKMKKSAKPTLSYRQIAKMFMDNEMTAEERNLFSADDAQLLETLIKAERKHRQKSQQ